MEYHQQPPAAMASSASRPETFLLSPGAEQSLPQSAQLALQQVDNLKFFLLSAPVDWGNDQYIRRFLLPTGEYVSCVLWNTLFHISGTDIVRCLAFRFQAFGRPVKNPKKFEEGIFSDLRNLKSGNDASLEDPKSPFLDFLYKHNCIRTQKKQKVFYWYSVPHDRLFLDALERDLKREKAGQEPTTEAVEEPALSFEFDASQSLFEQLTKTQQEHAGLDPNATHHYSQSPPPPDVHADTLPLQQQQMVSQPAHAMSQDNLGDMGAYRQSTMPQAESQQMANTPTFEQPQYAPYNGNPEHRHSFPAAQPVFRHGSMPAPYMEYSPAPSFVSSQSHYEENRGISYEPITPPQQVQQYTPEPSYTPNDEGGLYNAMPEVQQQYSNVNQFPAPNFPMQPYNDGKGIPAVPASSMYSHIEGSPQYRQQASRKSSLTYGSPGPARTPHSVRRPSDLRRAVSASVAPMTEHYVERAVSGPPGPYQYQTPTPDASRHASPLVTVERQQSMPVAHAQLGSAINEHYSGEMLPPDAHIAGPFRRARSATTSDMFGGYGRDQPYSQKTHSCPIPNCGRMFKRLEHLKRHVRTHTQERPYVCKQCNKAFSRSDNLAQHRRTHEEQSDNTFPALPEEEVETGDSGVHHAGEQITADSSFASVQSYDTQGSDLLSAPGSMGPPPLPASIMGSY